MMKRLKYGLFGLVVFLGIISFCSAFDLSISTYCPNFCDTVLPYYTGLNIWNDESFSMKLRLRCLRSNGNYQNYDVTIPQDSIFTGSKPTGCASIEKVTIQYCGSQSSCTFKYSYSDLSIGGGGCPICPEVNTGEILSGYILESEIDNLYCEDHGYCPLINTGEIIGTGDNWSALFINDIQHPSAPLINITIPEEFDWTYTGNDEVYDVEIKGFNVDTEYIDGIIRNQTTLPNKIDFNNTISGLIPLLVPGLVIIMFFIFIFRFIKKIF